MGHSIRFHNALIFSFLILAMPSNGLELLTRSLKDASPIIDPKDALYKDDNVAADTDLKDTYSYTSKNTSFYSRVKRINETTSEKVMTELLKFIIGSLTGRNIYIFHEGLFPDISATADICFRRWAEATIFLCDDALKNLQDILGTQNTASSPLNILVICSESNTMKIFQKIRENALESADLQWFVILQSHIISDVVRFVREGTQITFAVKGHSTINHYYLMASYINTHNDVSTKYVGWWSWDLLSGPKIHLKMGLHRAIKDSYSDFGGRKLRVSMLNNMPFWILEDHNDDKIHPVGGIDFTLLKMLGEKLNFTFEASLSPDRLWGGVLKDGKVTGMVGAVHRHEVHLAINELTITAPREKAVDFTIPYFLESTTIVTPAPSKLLNPQAVFSPFKPMVWGLFAFSTLLIGFTVKAFGWVRWKLLDEDPKYHPSLGEMTFNFFRSTVTQGNLLNPQSWCFRSLFCSWFFFCLLVTTLYSGILISVLTVPTYEKPINSLENLLDAMKHRGTKLILGCGSNNEFIFSMTDQKIYQDIWALFDRSVGCINTWDEGIEKVLTGNYAFTNNRMGAEVRASLRGHQKFHFAHNEFYPHGYSIACPTGSPYKSVFEKELIWLMSTGLIQKLARTELIKSQKPVTSTEKDKEAFTIQHLQAGFYLLVMGYIVATGIFISEMVYYHYLTWIVS
ncbi:glutamate receptor ionotropic, delta-2-like [Palaemon carinicauda]|uniref:glutamate receptor ionotropic, delta-2-like n=1 Tax=Palaemon carinicauda TaxID=392227 RepID=UPI0035B59DD1